MVINIKKIICLRKKHYVLKLLHFQNKIMIIPFKCFLNDGEAKNSIHYMN